VPAIALEQRNGVDDDESLELLWLALRRNQRHGAPVMDHQRVPLDPERPQELRVEAREAVHRVVEVRRASRATPSRQIECDRRAVEALQERKPVLRMRRIAVDEDDGCRGSLPAADEDPDPVDGDGPLADRLHRPSISSRE
jgi:hypothetical protein